MTRRAALAAAALALAGCVVDRAAPPERFTDLRGRAELVDGPLPVAAGGHLAYVGADGNVYVVDPATAETVQVTADASSADTGSGIFHTGLAWSRGGRLAFARTDTEAFRSSLFVTVPGRSARRIAGPAGILIYASWARSGERLATITDADGTPGGDVALTVREVPAASPPRPLLEERGGQIYFAWGREDGLVRHLLDLDRRHLDEVDLAGGAATGVGGSLAPFLAPAVANGRIVYAVADARVSEPEVTVDAAAVVVHAPTEARRVAFAPSPDGRRLAFAVRGPRGMTPDDAFAPARIVDLATGEVTVAGPRTLFTKAFYWSPDGGRLAYLNALDSGAASSLSQWRLFDVEANEDRGLAAFQPTATFETLTTFFDQFGQSHPLWSPDGRYLTYAAVADGEAHVWLLDTREESGRRTLVADGVVAAFSWR